MKLGPVTKFDKKNKTTLKNIDYEVMSKYWDVIAIFSIYGQFAAIWKLDSGHMVYKTYIFKNLFLTKTENRTEKSLIQLSHYCFE